MSDVFVMFDGIQLIALGILALLAVTTVPYLAFKEIAYRRRLRKRKKGD